MGMPSGSVPTDIPPRRNSPSIGHRSSFAENLRNTPRTQRPPSFSQLQIHDYINTPAVPKSTNSRFAGRDWRTIKVSELVDESHIKWAELDSDFETFTKILIDVDNPNVILIRKSASDRVACDAFDFNDLNAYLLVILGLAKPEPEQIKLYERLVQKSLERAPVQLKEVIQLARKAELVTLPESAELSRAIELFGGGCHRILICKDGTDEVKGMLSQSRVLRFMWENGANFPGIHQLYSAPLRDLSIGNHAAISINGDQPLQEALKLMASECLSSIAVVDNALNVVGNISSVDTRLLTRASSIPLLSNTCIHFISVILTERGIHDGKDSFPVFHVSTAATLSQTVSKLIATRSHRLWVVEPASPSPSLPATPTSAFSTPFTPSSTTTSTSHSISGSTLGTSPSHSSTIVPHTAVPAAALPGANISGRLTGVVSLTDILNIFARQSGLHPLDPSDQRAQRRRSSSSSMRPSLDLARGLSHGQGSVGGGSGGGSGSSGAADHGGDVMGGRNHRQV